MAEYLRLNKSSCKNCYKCIRHCPVKAIRFSGNQAHIVNDECILCGQCYVVCPQNAKEIVDETGIVKTLLCSGAPVIASIAPSFVAYFEDTGIDALREALRSLGFADAEEAAIGATFVKREFDRLCNEELGDIIISSCCHSVNLLIGKHYPELAKYLAPVVSPMHAHCADIKKRVPGAKTVFIGPCLSKKDETGSDAVDAVLTFRELTAMLFEHEITIKKQTDKAEKSHTRLFPTVGGILRTMKKSNPRYTYLTVDGTTNCMAALDDISQGKLSHCFIEMSACQGSCIGGPVMEKYRNNPVRHYLAVNSYAGAEDFDVLQPEIAAIHKNRPYMGCKKQIPSEEQIREVMLKMGKNTKADELNCGTCGYDTCREKAIAVCQGKADISMCLPYLMEKSERFSNTILNNTPNGMLVLNEGLEVQQINRAALSMLGLGSPSDILGEQVVNILNPVPFMDVLDKGTGIHDRREYFAEYKRYLEQTIVYDRTSHILIDIIRDVTDEETEKLQKEEVARKTAEIADNVVNKQMRIVQEIASLLGETTAETKIALTRLKESMPHEE